MIKLVKFTIAGIILGIVSALVFDVGYFATVFITGNTEYGLHAGLYANIFIVLGMMIDIANTSYKSRPKEDFESDLIPKGFKPVTMPDDIKKEIDPNKGQSAEEYRQIIGDEAMISGNDVYLKNLK